MPNHSLLDSPVTNLTLSDNFVQTFVTIGVERDVDVTKAKWDMLEIAFSESAGDEVAPAGGADDGSGHVLDHVQIHFWLQYSNYMQTAIVQSQILEQISDLFQPPPQAPTADGEAAAERAATGGGGRGCRARRLAEDGHDRRGSTE